LRQGCGSDVPGHWYSLSRALNPHWSSFYPSQRELQAYWDALWVRAGLRTHTRCGTEVVRATWDPAARTYAVELEDTTSRARRTVVARVVINATGGFQAPVIPEDLLADTRVFEGESWHSAQWRRDVSLGGKRVGVIGNGCSAYVFFFLRTRAPIISVAIFQGRSSCRRSRRTPRSR
jgi:cation diffusion facilitator CzcD-associated flavoprotein CzcO